MKGLNLLTYVHTHVNETCKTVQDSARYLQDMQELVCKTKLLHKNCNNKLVMQDNMISCITLHIILARQRYYPCKLLYLTKTCKSDVIITMQLMQQLLRKFKLFI